MYTFLNSSDPSPALTNYQVPLDEVPSLKELIKTRQTRIIDDMSVMAGSNKKHTQKLLQAGFQSSLTIPMYSAEHFQGFLFFNSLDKNFFTQVIRSHLSVYAQLISAIIEGEMSRIRTLQGAMKTAREFSRYRDEETGSHLTRMAHYARFIAIELADHFRFDDRYIEYVLQFAPLHDIGKIAIPDNILLKKARLDDQEKVIMRTHVEKGVAMIDTIVRELGLQGIEHTTMLRNIVAYHHECYDGSGYPNGIASHYIPVEASIVTAADVFDALTSSRPYKEAWSFEDAEAYMVEQKGKIFHPLCVEALQRRIADMQSIRNRFEDEPF